jgi:hypothetical protein
MLRSLVALTAIALPLAAHAGTIVVFPPQTTNVSPGEADAAGALLAEGFKAASGDAVIGPVQAGEALQGNKSLQQAAQSLGAERYVESSLVGLQKSLVLSADLIEVNGGSRRHRQMTLATLDDMQPASERIARALLTDTAVTSNETVDTVTDKEAEGMKRKKANRIGGFRVGMLAPVAKGYKFDQGFQIVYDLRLEQRNYFMNIATGAMFGINGRGGDPAISGWLLELGAAYWLSDGDFAPYIGGGLSPRIMSVDEVRFGLAPYAVFGTTLGRTSTAHFSAELRAYQNVIRQTIKVGPPASNGDRAEEDVFPTELGAFVGIWW